MNDRYHGETQHRMCICGSCLPAVCLFHKSVFFDVKGNYFYFIFFNFNFSLPRGAGRPDSEVHLVRY